MYKINKIINYARDFIPETFYGKTYDYFSFDVYNDIPISLELGVDTDDGLVITRINEIWIKRARKGFVSFLQSIKIDNSYPTHPLSMDLKVARDVYGVDMKVGRWKRDIDKERGLWRDGTEKIAD